MKLGAPLSRPGQVIGLLGGSFDPAHAGHVQITLEALKQFRLDQLWWLVSPGNPLKSVGPAPMPKRLEQARAIMGHPQVHITDLEAQLGTRYTAQTLAALRQALPGVRFIWLMGADNLAQLHYWQDWRNIVAAMPIGVLARPEHRISARMSKAARIYRTARLPARRAALLAASAPPCWCFLNVPMSSLSSTEIRSQGDWTGLST
ncbi:MAG: nicotinate-nucleotide adenylyltransferase [Pseudomonadota bacterium]